MTDKPESVKITLLGDSGVGKTCIINRYMSNQFTNNCASTAGASYQQKLLTRGNKKLQLDIWDTAGQERYTSMITTYYKGTKGALLVYDITRRNTFDNIEKWLKELISLNSNNICVTLIGNNNDVSLLR